VLKEKKKKIATFQKETSFFTADQKG